MSVDGDFMAFRRKYGKVAAALSMGRRQQGEALETFIDYRTIDPALAVPLPLLIQVTARTRQACS